MEDFANSLPGRVNQIADACRLVLEKRQDKRILAVSWYGSVVGRRKIHPPQEVLEARVSADFLL